MIHLIPETEDKTQQELRNGNFGMRWKEEVNEDGGEEEEEVKGEEEEEEEKIQFALVKLLTRFQTSSPSSSSSGCVSNDKSSSSHVYQCTWPKCYFVTSSLSTVEDHVRQSHLKLGPKKERRGTEDDDSDLSDHEEEFYYTEVEFDLSSSPPTMSHMDMCRPPMEDPEYQKNLSKPGLVGHSPSSQYSSHSSSSSGWPRSHPHSQSEQLPSDLLTVVILSP
ncbi:hypothetical protein WDU94_001978 [Cyamophila willieti]